MGGHSFKNKLTSQTSTNSHTVRASLLGSSEIVTLIAVKIHTPLNTHIDANVRIVNSNMKHRFLQNELKTTDTGETLWECLMNQMLLYGIEYCHIKTLNQMQPHVLGCCHSLHQCVRWIISISAGRSQGITEICHVLQPLHLRMVRKDKMTRFDSKSPSLSLLRDTSLCLQREEVGKRRETRRGRVCFIAHTETKPGP